MLNRGSHAPLAVFPSQGFVMRDRHFIWYLNDRLQTPQPERVRLQKRGVTTCCKSTRGEPRPVTDSHLQSCITNRKIFHNTIRHELFKMCNAANLVVSVEKRGLVPGTRMKPADVYIDCWSANEGFTACAIDVVTTDAESNLTANTQPSVRRQRENVSGIQARSADQRKRRKKLEGFAGTPTIQEYLQAREIKFVPFAVEGTGAFGPAVRPFIKQVSQEAKNNGSTCSASDFRRIWELRLAMCIAKGRCSAALDRVSKLCSKNSTYDESNPYIPLVDDYVLVTEFPELQDDSEDTYTPREDDPASISNDDGGRLSSGSECDDDDADCDGAAALPNGHSNVVALTR